MSIGPSPYTSKEAYKFRLLPYTTCRATLKNGALSSFVISCQRCSHICSTFLSVWKAGMPMADCMQLRRSATKPPGNTSPAFLATVLTDFSSTTHELLDFTRGTFTSLTICLANDSSLIEVFEIRLDFLIFLLILLRTLLGFFIILLFFFELTLRMDFLIDFVDFLDGTFLGFIATLLDFLFTNFPLFLFTQSLVLLAITLWLDVLFLFAMFRWLRRTAADTTLRIDIFFAIIDLLCTDLFDLTLVTVFLLFTLFTIITCYRAEFNLININFTT